MIFCFFSWSGHFFLMGKERSGWTKTQKVFYSAVSIIVIASAIYIFELLFPSMLNNMLLAEVPFSKRWTIIGLRGFIVSAFFFYLSRYIHIVNQKQQALIELEQMKRAHLEASIASLKEQLSPHFMFNTLNTLSSLTEDKVVKDYVNQLANVYRYVLQYKDVNAATLKQEMEFISSYVYIIKSRLEDAVQIDFNIPAEILDTKIPPLTLQILIENAVKHNVAVDYKPLYISITTNLPDELIVENNFQPKQSVGISTGTGLVNISRRYNWLFNRDIDINQTESSFIVKLPIIR